MIKEMKMNKTKSFCPVCKKIIGADVFEKGGSIFMKKNCVEHGVFEIKIAKYAWYYKGLNSYYDALYGSVNSKKNRGSTFTFDVASKCNLNCPICANPGNEGSKFSKSLFKNQIEMIKNRKMFIHLSGGGEPTLNDDLPELIDIISKSGNAASLVTNGVRISEDFNYFKRLKESGLKNVCTWIDSVENEDVHQKMRGGRFIDLKMKLLHNAEKLKIPVKLLQVLAQRVNEQEVKGCLDFARRNDCISTFWIRSYSHFGNCGLSKEQEFENIDEVVEVVAEKSEGLFSIMDVFIFQKFLYAVSAISGQPMCYRDQVMIVPRKNEKSMRQIFDFDKTEKMLDEFKKIWQENRKKAKGYFIKKNIFKIVKNQPFFRLLLKKKLSSFGWDSFYSKGYLTVLISSSYNLLNCDISRINKQCLNFVVDQGSGEIYSRCIDTMGAKRVN